MGWGLSVETEPTVEPVSLAEAKNHLRVSVDDDDNLIERTITAARRFCEQETGRRFINTTLKLWLDAFPNVIVLPGPPLSSVTNIQYVDTDGDTQTLSSSVYQVTSGREPAEICEAYGQVWPSTRTIPEAVFVNYVAGYGATAASVPAGLRDAILLMVSHLYEMREPTVTGTTINTVPMALQSLLTSHKSGYQW